MFRHKQKLFKLSLLLLCLFFTNTIIGQNPDIDYFVVETGVDVGTYSSITCDASNNLHFSYYDNNSDNLKYAKGTANNYILQTIDEGGDVGRYSTIAIDNSGNINIVYYDATKKTLKYAGWLPTWETEIVDSYGDVGQYSSISLNSNNLPFISYYDASSQNLKFASFNGSSWSQQMVDADGDVGRYSCMVVDSEDNFNIVYYDATNKTLKYAGWLPTWEYNTIDAVGDVGQYSSIDCDNYNQIYISYYDATNDDLKFSSNSGFDWIVETVAEDGDIGRYSTLAVNNNTVDPEANIIAYDGTNRTMEWATKTLPVNTLPGNLEFSPGNISFGKVQVGSTNQTRTLQVFNSGQGVVSITGISITGADQGSFSYGGISFPVYVSPNNTMEIQVSFSPVSTGLKMANLEISHLFGSASPSVIQLQGDGVIDIVGEVDLRPLGVLTESDNIVSGQEVQFDVYYQNMGYATSPAHTTRLYLTPYQMGNNTAIRNNPLYNDEVIGQSILIGEFLMDAITPGEIGEKIVALDIPLIHGEKYLTIWEDNSNTVAESNDLNNVRTSVKTIMFVTSLPDLTGTVKVSANQWSEDGEITLSAQVSNLGMTNTGSFNCRFYLSTDNVIDNNDIPLSSIEHIQDGIESMGSYSFEKDYTVPGDLALGDYYVGLLIDADEEIVEEDELNNAIYWPELIVVTEPTGIKISGTITSVDGGGEKPLSGVEIKGLPNSPKTDINGYFETYVPLGWSGTIKPENSSYLQYLPEVIEISPVFSNQSQINFTSFEPFEILQGIKDSKIVSMSEYEQWELAEQLADGIAREVVGDAIPGFVEDVTSLYSIYNEGDEVKQYFQLASFVIGKAGGPLGKIVSTYLEIGAEIIEQYQQMANGYFEPFLVGYPNSQTYELELKAREWWGLIGSVSIDEYRPYVNILWKTYTTKSGQFKLVFPETPMDISEPFFLNNYLKLNISGAPANGGNYGEDLAHFIVIEWLDSNDEVAQKTIIPVTNKFLFHSGGTEWRIKMRTNRKASFKDGFYKYLNIVTP